jgi:hypothetical protein
LFSNIDNFVGASAFQKSGGDADASDFDIDLLEHMAVSVDWKSNFQELAASDIPKIQV